MKPKTFPTIPNSELKTDLWELSNRLLEHRKQVLAFIESEDSIGFDRRKLFNYSIQLKCRLNDIAQRLSLQIELEDVPENCFSR